MKIFYTDEFIKKLERLPTETQKLDLLIKDFRKWNFQILAETKRKL